MDGETKAQTFLEQKAYQVLDTNIRLRNREVDLIALDKKTNELVFVEVKTRRTKAFGNPSLAVNQKKIRSLHTVARAYLKKYKLKNDYRFDIISITPKEIEHFKNITWP